MPDETDHALLDRARSGDAHAIETLLERHQGRVYRFGMKMCRDPEDARDVLQDTLLAMARGVRDFRGASSLSTLGARRLVDTGAHLVDVRTPDEFTAGHLPGAVNIPLQELEHRMRELEPKEQPVVVYCRSGSRSGSAARLLESAGYRAVYDLGPLSRWCNVSGFAGRVSKHHWPSPPNQRLDRQG